MFDFQSVTSRQCKVLKEWTREMGTEATLATQVRLCHQLPHTAHLPPPTPMPAPSHQVATHPNRTPSLKAPPDAVRLQQDNRYLGCFVIHPTVDGERHWLHLVLCLAVIQVLLQTLYLHLTVGCQTECFFFTWTPVNFIPTIFSVCVI